jgi:hypothetical protein
MLQLDGVSNEQLNEFRMTLTVENRSTRRMTFQNASFSATCSGLAMCQDLHGKRPTTV